MAKLTNNERSPFTDTIILSYADLAAIQAGTKSGVIGSVPVGGAVELVGIATVEAFSAVTTGGTLTVSDGTVGSPNVFFASAIPTQAVGVGSYNTGAAFTTAGTKAISSGSGTNITLAVGNTVYASMTAGKIIIGIRVIDLAALAS